MKIKRTYRLTPKEDKLVKQIARKTKVSQNEVISRAIALLTYNTNV